MEGEAVWWQVELPTAAQAGLDVTARADAYGAALCEPYHQASFGHAPIDASDAIGAIDVIENSYAREELFRAAAPRAHAAAVTRASRRFGAIVAENGKSITVSPSESVFHRSESVFETVNRYRFSV